MRDKPRILRPGESYTFSKYFELPFATEDILADLDCRLERTRLDLPKSESTPTSLVFLSRYIPRNLTYINPVSEAARREVLIAPTVLEICAETNSRLNIEYQIAVNDYLKGSLDYYITGRNTLLIIEAKQSDLSRGFTQLAVELIAVDQWTRSQTPILYGAVTNGEDWRFGIFQRLERQIVQDINLYRVPEGLEDLLKILIGILVAG